ncbi:MAG: sterol desaturase family protein [Actinobacteria bacterium]|nr:sterol desaturase family protein [Actinomycetota bacterium]
MARLELFAIPAYYATMGIEYAHHRRRAERGITTDGDYERCDTLTSLTMGGLSLVVPLVAPRIVDPITPGKGRYARYLLGGTVGAIAATSIADAYLRRTADGDPDGRDRHRVGDSDHGSPRARRRRIARRVARVGGVASISGSVVAATAWWNDRIRPQRMWRSRVVPDLGSGVVAWTVAILGWDLLYYVNHRLWHSTRFMWANHVMHHSSEHYNLSTALRQAATDPLLITVPYSGLSLLGVRPELVATSRSINLLYQYWVHTDAIRTLGVLEEFANTPSHHRVHHGSDTRYIDRNHGGMLIVFDRLFGTFTREDGTPTYGLTKNIDTFNPLRVVTHEYADILRDVAGSDNWRDRLSFTFRGPGWAYARHRAEAERMTDLDVGRPDPVDGSDDVGFAVVETVAG